MANVRDAFLTMVLALVATLLLVFMFEPALIGESLRAIDDARFIDMEQDNGPILD